MLTRNNNMISAFKGKKSISSLMEKAIKSAMTDDFGETSSFTSTESLSSFNHSKNDDKFHHPIHDPFDLYIYPGQDLVIDEGSNLDY